MGRMLSDIAFMQKEQCAVKEYVAIIKDILKNEDVQEMRKYRHHGHVDCLNHSLQVSYLAYRIGKQFNMDYEALARAGLLHDFYLYDWHDKSDREGMHGFTHAQAALDNAEERFELNDMERDIIKHHMWPLNIGLPKYRESVVMMFADRYCAFMEMLGVAPLQLRMYQ